MELPHPIRYAVKVTKQEHCGSGNLDLWRGEWKLFFQKEPVWVDDSEYMAHILANVDADADIDEIEEAGPPAAEGVEVILVHRKDIRKSKERRWFGVAYREEPCGEIDMISVEWTHFVPEATASMSIEEGREIAVSFEEEHVTANDYPPNDAFLLRPGYIVYGIPRENSADIIDLVGVDGYEVIVALDESLVPSEPQMHFHPPPPQEESGEEKIEGFDDNSNSGQ